MLSCLTNSAWKFHLKDHRLYWTDEHNAFNLSRVETQSDMFLAYTGYRYRREDNNNHVYCTEFYGEDVCWLEDTHIQ